LIVGNRRTPMKGSKLHVNNGVALEAQHHGKLSRRRFQELTEQLAGTELVAA
jgi:hypothetical protein